MDTVNKRGAVVLGAIAITVIALMYFDYMLGPIGIETDGVATASTPITDEYGHAWMQVSVRLNDGSIVEAKAPPACVVMPGQAVRVQGFRSMYSFTRTYLYLGEKKKDET